MSIRSLKLYWGSRSREFDLIVVGSVPRDRWSELGGYGRDWFGVCSIRTST